eukprot:11900804-Alexandrium_andersonii.AAC.1
MSASLVGSEMCIRDSFSALPDAGCGDRSCSSRALVFNLGDLFREGTLVSYTHLTLPTICSV